MTVSSLGGGTLKYPAELSQTSADYMVFRHSEYRTNREVAGSAIAGRGTTRGGPPAASNSSPIIFYMPSNTPSTINPNGWGDASFNGPLGVVISDAKQAVAGAALNTNGASFKTADAAKRWGESQGNAILEQVKSSLETGPDGVSGAVGAAQQAAITFIGGGTPKGANQLLAMNRGQIYNPNVELLYDGPGLRQFSFSFDMFPKSAQEAATINKIVKEFKIWSAPEDLENGMYEVPHIWQIEYCSGSGMNKNYNEFKECALVNVAVVNNNSVKGYMAFENGMPIQTTLSLSFSEVDVITRNDQRDSRSNVGF